MTERVKVVFASLLKPVDEPRMYEKLGSSLAQTYKYDVNIIGFASKNLQPDPLISFWPLFNFPRISFQRVLAPLAFLKKIIQLKPEVIILNSPDFMEVSMLYKILFGADIIYDIRDNYYRNIIWSHKRPSLLRRLRAAMIRTREKLFDRTVIQYTFAEACYSTECSFITKPYLVLENKALKPDKAPPARKASPHAPLRLLYSGTIAASYGIFDTLPLVEKIASFHPALEYHICGHCPSQEVYDKLISLSRDYPWMKLSISPEPIPHQLILEQLKHAHFSLIAYQLNPSNENCMPTRIWEALAWQTPMILRKEHPWTKFAEQQQAGFAIDFLEADIDNLQHHLFDRTYYQEPPGRNIYWQDIEPEWIKLMDSLCLHRKK